MVLWNVFQFPPPPAFPGTAFPSGISGGTLQGEKGLKARGERARSEKRCKGLFVSAFPRERAQRSLWALPSQKWIPGIPTETQLRELTVRQYAVILYDRKYIENDHDPIRYPHPFCKRHPALARSHVSGFQSVAVVVPSLFVRGFPGRRKAV